MIMGMSLIETTTKIIYVDVETQTVSDLSYQKMIGLNLKDSRRAKRAKDEQ